MDKKLKNKMLIAAGFGAGAAATGAFLHWNNSALQLKKYDLDFEDLPPAFDGFKIVQISDFHNTKFLENKVIRYTRREMPDLIAITGDLFDCRRPDFETGFSLAEKLVKIAPVYMVCGNHEARMEATPLLRARLKEIGVRIVENERLKIARGKDKVTLAGIDDPRFFAGEKLSYTDKRTFAQNLRDILEADDSFEILLSHRPDFFPDYCELGVDLSLTGHAHGGQFGIPFTDMGVYLPSQGLFPEYCAGKKQKDKSTMIISRGIGNSQFPFRLFNLPEVVSITMWCEKTEEETI